MKILICGDRKWTNRNLIKEKILEYSGTIIIEGDAKGADRISGEIARELGLEVRVYPAQWEKYGRSAGPIRNRQQFDLENPDLVLAFHNDIENSKGTKDMIKYAKNNYCKVVLISEPKGS